MQTDRHPNYHLSHQADRGSHPPPWDLVKARIASESHCELEVSWHAASLGPLDIVDCILFDAAAQITVELLPDLRVAPNSQPICSANGDCSKAEDGMEPMGP